MAKKIALVLGNGGYKHCSTLKNAVNDAALITHRLQKLGYEIYGGAKSAKCDTPFDGGMNLGFAATAEVVGKFVGAAEPGTTAVVYFAGHGVEANGLNYLVPSDYDPASGRPQFGCIDIKGQLQKLADTVKGSGTVVLFLDACRESCFDPPVRSEMAAAGDDARSPLHAPVHSEAVPSAAQSSTTRGGLYSFKMKRDADVGQTFIGFATAPGDFAMDGKRENSAFASALDRHLKVRGMEIAELYDRVARDVAHEVAHDTGEIQVPWSETNLNRPLILHERSGLPIFVMGIGGLVTGFAICALLFEKSRLVPAIPNWYWGLGLLFGLVVAFGTLKWGSGAKPRDVAFALLGPGIGFALALAVLQIIPPFPSEFQTGEQLTGARDLAADIFRTVTLAGGVLYIVGTIAVRAERREPWPRTPLGWFNWALTWCLPIIIVGVLLRLQSYMAGANPLSTAIAMFALLGGVIYATSVALSCRSQGGNFAHFGPFTGAITVGLLMSAFFAIFTALVDGRAKALDANNWLMIALGSGWHALLGAQLGYCFTYYVPNYRRRELDLEREA